jgi:hypothetical protein
VNTARQSWQAWLVTLMGSAAFATAQSTNSAPATNNVTASPPPRVETAPQKLDESAFRLVTERNIFNANRSGGQVRLASRRPARVDSFTLVGTMAYEKGAFAFFEGSSSEFTKALKADGVIAGHKLVDIYTDSVKLEADGKEIELAVGSQMRREDQGAWHESEAGGSYAVASSGDENNSRSRDYSSRNGDSSRSSRYSRSDRGSDNRSRRGSDSSSDRRDRSEPAAKPAESPAPSAAEQSEILKRLAERREKESP